MAGSAKVPWKSQKGHNAIVHMKLVLLSKFFAWKGCNQLKTVTNLRDILLTAE